MYAAEIHVQLYMGIMMATFIYVSLNGRSLCAV